MPNIKEELNKLGVNTEADLRRYLNQQGFSKSTSRRAVRGFKKYGEARNRGVEFELGQDSFKPSRDVSERIGGDREGFQISDLIGAGTDVSTLAAIVKRGSESNKTEQTSETKRDIPLPTTSFGDPLAEFVKTGKKDIPELIPLVSRRFNVKAKSSNTTTPKSSTPETTIEVPDTTPVDPLAERKTQLDDKQVVSTRKINGVPVINSGSDMYDHRFKDPSNGAVERFFQDIPEIYRRSSDDLKFINNLVARMIGEKGNLRPLTVEDVDAVSSPSEKRISQEEFGPDEAVVDFYKSFLEADKKKQK